MQVCVRRHVTSPVYHLTGAPSNRLPAGWAVLETAPVAISGGVGPVSPIPYASFRDQRGQRARGTGAWVDLKDNSGVCCGVPAVG